MKKILNFIRTYTILFLWTIFFVFILENLLSVFWNFNILSYYSWKTLSNFWNNGGIFKTPADITLLFILVMTPFLFIIGFVKIKKINYFEKLCSFFKFLKKRPKENHERILIKNIKSTEQIIENIKNEIASIKPEKNKEAFSVRSKVLNKLNKDKKK